MAKYRKKPVVVDAMRWTGKNTAAVRKFCGRVTKIYDGHKIAYLLISTNQGKIPARKGDWIIRRNGKILTYCPPDIFAETYEKVEDGGE